MKTYRVTYDVECVGMGIVDTQFDTIEAEDFIDAYSKAKSLDGWGADYYAKIAAIDEEVC